MSEAPKKIWAEQEFRDWAVDPLDYASGTELTQYIRADLVDGLVEALESCRVETKTYGDQGYVFTQHFDEQKVIAALAALKEET